MQKYPFCSDPYLDAAQRLLRTLLERAGAELGRETFSSCLVCERAPATLPLEPDGSVAWTMVVGGGRAEVSRGRDEGVYSLVVADYETALARARRIIGDDPAERLPEEEGVRRTGDMTSLSEPMRALLRAFHNGLAELTI
jgi:hypothetical protein